MLTVQPVFNYNFLFDRQISKKFSNVSSNEQCIEHPCSAFGDAQGGSGFSPPCLVPTHRPQCFCLCSFIYSFCTLQFFPHLLQVFAGVSSCNDPRGSGFSLDLVGSRCWRWQSAMVLSTSQVHHNRCLRSCSLLL